MLLRHGVDTRQMTRPEINAALDAVNLLQRKQHETYVEHYEASKMLWRATQYLLDLAGLALIPRRPSGD